MKEKTPWYVQAKKQLEGPETNEFKKARHIFDGIIIGVGIIIFYNLMCTNPEVIHECFYENKPSEVDKIIWAVLGGGILHMGVTIIKIILIYPIICLAVDIWEDKKYYK